MPKKKVPTEAWEQEQFFRWIYSNQVRYPELALVNGSMNGVRVAASIRKRLKGQGVRPGVPDIDIPIARGRYHGMRIELKRTKGGRVSPDQKLFLDRLRGAGYHAIVCKGWLEAASELRSYLGIGDGIGLSPFVPYS